MEREKWLLTNGEVATEPDLETSPSGRKIRVAGTTESFWERDLEENLLKAVEVAAKAKDAEVWMPLNKASESGYYDASGATTFHPVDDPTSRYASSNLWWRFQHPELPIEAVVVVSLQRMYAYGSQTIPQRLSVTVVSNRLAPYKMYGLPDVQQVSAMNQWIEQVFDPEARSKFYTWATDYPPTSLTEVMGFKDLPNERLGVEAFLKMARKVDDWMTVRVPDLRDADNPGWLELEFVDSNVTERYMSDLAEFLDGIPLIADAVKIYDQLRDTLRKAGINMAPMNEDAFRQAMVAKDDTVASFTVENLSEQGHQTDHEHSLSVHMPSGTFVVSCNKRTDLNQIAEKWEEVQTIATLTGEEEALEKFQAVAIEVQSNVRLAEILKERLTGKA